ncbi:MAG: hypothetical protein PHR94_07040 [Methylomonas lenta]|nr:hypothetical protein [Methylomonas lenta]
MIAQLLILGWFSPLMPRRAPKGLSGYARRGDAGMHRVFRGGWEAPSENPVQSLGAQDKRGMGCRFFWILFFGQAKKSIPPAGAGTGIK